MIGPLIAQQVSSGNLIMLLHMLGLEDPTGQNDDDFRIAWMIGSDADDNAANNLGGAGEFLVPTSNLEADGSPSTSIQSRVASGALRGGPEDIPIPVDFFPIELKQGRIEGTLVADSGELFELRDGQLCGGISLSIFALLSTFTGDMLMTDPPCDGGDPAGLIDVLVGGGSATFSFGDMSIPLSFRATAPDLDLDADGLEGFGITRDGPTGCQAVITACTDGDGTLIDGRGCYNDPRIQDGYSAAFAVTGIDARIVGVEGTTGGGGG